MKKILFYIICFVVFLFSHSVSAFAQIVHNPAEPITHSQSYPSNNSVDVSRMTVEEISEQELTGRYERHYESGNLFEQGSFRQGQYQGEIKRYYENGVLQSSIYYQNGLPEGKAMAYFANGNLKEERVYAQGKMNGLVKQYYENGKLKYMSRYINDVQDGEIVIFREDGQLEMEGKINLGIFVGNVYKYYPNGKLEAMIGRYGDQLEGKSQLYSQYGDLIVEEYYLNGKLIDQNKNMVQQQEPMRSKALRGMKQIFSKFSFWSYFVLAGLLIFTVFFIKQKVIKGLRAQTKTTKEKEPAILLSEETDTQTEQQWKQKKIYRTEENLSELKRNDLLSPNSPLLFRRLIETVDIGLFVADTRGNLIYVNHAFAKKLAFKTIDKLLGVNVHDLFIPFEEEYTDIWERLCLAKSAKNFKVKFNKNNGEKVVLSVSGNAIYNDKGTPIGIEGVLDDVTDQSRLEENVLTEKQKLEMVLEFCDEIDTFRDFESLTKFIVDGISRILEAQKCSLMMENRQDGYLTIKQAKGLDAAVIEETRMKIGEPIAGQVALQQTPLFIKNIEYDQPFCQPNKPRYMGRSFMIAPFRFNNHSIGVINVADKECAINGIKPFSEIDFKILRILVSRVAYAIENIQLFQDLNLMTITDPMTQINNYRFLSETLDREIRMQQRSPQDLSLCIIDIDHFKIYNDTFGHLEGDHLLRRFSEILQQNVRSTDIVCRYAGDEFCVVFPHTDINGAQQVMEKIRLIVEKTEFRKPVTVSAGIASHVIGEQKTALLKKADQALYRAKEGRRNRVEVFNDGEVSEG